ncbi:unnamed protein product [Danaus chrysippus]|uniref:(African queen) hypothetical protein n=1 Tax=Danaus chrysippus TaxID=151541 RepID=A0A8J2QXG6_9NEOP|nr:unnamed protein product [Danaus chrysippus]
MILLVCFSILSYVYCQGFPGYENDRDFQGFGAQNMNPYPGVQYGYQNNPRQSYSERELKPMAMAQDIHTGYGSRPRRPMIPMGNNQVARPTAMNPSPGSFDSKDDKSPMENFPEVMKNLPRDGVVMVPVIDYSIERLGLTSTVRPVITTDARTLLTLRQNIDLKTVDQGDWLAFETALGGRNDSDRCRTFSCNYVINAKYTRGGGTWDQHYPQYDEKNIRNPNPMYE